MTKQYYVVDISKDTLQIATRSSSTSWQDLKIANEITNIEEWLLTLDLPSLDLVYEYTGTYAHRLTTA